MDSKGYVEVTDLQHKPPKHKQYHQSHISSAILSLEPAEYKENDIAKHEHADKPERSIEGKAIIYPAAWDHQDIKKYGLCRYASCLVQQDTEAKLHYSGKDI